ncbi:MAG: M20/M25/M40 family metallo-hydrolase [Ferruginibacter sp.]|nr:M20/M25/M40 family metallo-hydrolase [Chitinophagaceae bacterium]
MTQPMRRIFPMGLLATTAFFLLFSPSCTGQKGNSATGDMDALLNVREAERIEKILAADDMQGRRAFSPGIEKAANFIAAEFKATGLQAWDKSSSFRQEFAIIRAKMVSTSAVLDGQATASKNILVITCQPQVNITEKQGYEKVFIKPGSNLQTEARKYLRSNKNLLVLADTSFTGSFGNLSRLKSSQFKTDKNVVFILTTVDPASYSIEAVHEITEQKLANVVGVLPGKSRKDEYVIFSGHYDHLGIGKPVDGDSIYNGANDDAAGITGVIMLAKYFKQLNSNERTIVFAAFTAEEVGGFGSQYFSRQFNADKVMAMFNIEMIGTESKWGKNSAYITGYDKTNMGEILAKDLEGTGFTFYPDPYPTQQLFYRSDNATLARLGVPAHTISTSKMDIEPNYHKVTDHVETLDMENMTMIIKAIALSAKSIIAGTATPARVKVEDLR